MLESFEAARPLLATLAGVLGLLVLILWRKVPPFPALLVAAMFTGLAAGLAPDAVLKSITDGMGGVLGFIAVIVGLGAIFGAFLEATGAAQALAQYMTGDRKPGAAGVAMGFVGIVIAIPVFFDVGLILLFPLVQALARKAKKPAMYFGLPLLAGLATAHAFIPPTPGPVAVAEILGAELGLVILFGLICGIPAMLIGGPVYSGWAEKKGWLVHKGFADNGLEKAMAAEPPLKVDTVLALKGIFAIMVPIILIVAAAILKVSGANLGVLGVMLSFLGHPFVALMIACLLAYYILRPNDEKGGAHLQDTLSRAAEPTAIILLVTGAGGAFKQVLVDTGAGAALAEATLALDMGAITAGFILAAITRVAQGSATVAMLTAAGLCAPIAVAAGLGPVDLALMTIAIASGASILSHVNDSGFWLVSRFFDLSTDETLKSWTIASTLVGVTGFVIAFFLGAIF
jgi:Gnt-I system low-affinity gluconate transporter